MCLGERLFLLCPLLEGSCIGSTVFMLYHDFKWRTPPPPPQPLYESDSYKGHEGGTGVFCYL